MKKVISVLLLFALTGCASRAQNIKALYVSPLQYQSYNCTQVGEELDRVSRKVVEVSGQQNSTANKDAVAMGVGLVLFWPALFLLPGGDHKDELARLKGEYDAISVVAINKECNKVLAEIERANKKQQEIKKATLEKKAQERKEENSSTVPWNS